MEQHTREEKMAAFGRMLDILDELRVKCPWDRKQTNESLRPNTIEETYELCDALIKGDEHEVMKELGDVLLHVAFYAKIGEEKGQFDMADVCNFLCDKLIFRHPHVYGEQKAESVEQVLDNWEQIKQREKDGNKTVLSGVPAALPSLIKAYRIQDKARHVGFDWEHREDVWAKVREELDELEVEMARNDRQASEQELGDFLFAVINAARLYHLNPDNALEMTNQKFIRRFNYIEQRSKEMQKPMAEMTLQEMDQLWEEAKTVNVNPNLNLNVNGNGNLNPNLNPNLTLTLTLTFLRPTEQASKLERTGTINSKRDSELCSPEHLRSARNSKR